MNEEIRPHYSYSIALQIFHPSIQPEVITHALGISPKFSHQVGQARKTRIGTPLAGFYRQSYWCAELFQRGENSSTDSAVEDALAELQAIVQPHKIFIANLLSGEGRVLVKVSSYSDVTYAIEFSPQLMRQFAALGISLVNAIYPYAHHW